MWSWTLLHITVNVFEYIPWMLNYWLDLKLNRDLYRKCTYQMCWLLEVDGSVNQHLLRKFEFCEYKMYLNVEIVVPSMLLYNSKFNNFSENCGRCHLLTPSWFHNYNFIDIWWLVGISPLSQCSSNDYHGTIMWIVYMFVL